MAGGKGRSLSSRLKMLLIGIIVVLLLTTILSLLIIIRRERNEYAIRESEGVLQGLSKTIYLEMEGYKELSRMIMIEDRLVKYLRADSDEVSIGLINNARYGIMSILNVTENVDSVFVFREDRQYLTTALATNQKAYQVNLERMDEEDWQEQILGGRGNAQISINGNGMLQRTNKKPMITIGRAVYDLLTQKRTGIMMMNISDALIEKLVNGHLRGGDLCVVGTDGTFLAGREELLQFYSPEFESETVTHLPVGKGTGRFLLSGCRVEGMSIVVLCASGIGKREFPLGNVYVFLTLLLIFVISIFVAGAFITRQITDPVFRLTSAMEQNRQAGKLEKIDAGMPGNELAMLQDEYNNMIEHVNELIKSLIEKEKTLQKAEMRVLHEQIKPHFLYNSLETIGFLAMDAGAENVYTALEMLGSFYRNFLSKGDRELPLEREIRIVQDYLSLQKLRYGDIIHDEYDIAEDTRKCIIPKLILQPLVENSIYHGIRLKGEEGVIRISSFLQDGNLHIVVRDTGVGMEQERIDQLLVTGRDKREEEPSESFGLWGTIERIRCFCDSDDVVRIRSEIGEYTEIEFILPQRRESMGENENVPSDDNRR